MSARIRVLIADDSPTLRQALALLLSLEARIELVGQAGDGEEAVRLATALRPDVVTMDVEMPKLDGVSATEQIMERCPTRVLMVCSASKEREVELTFRAIAAGALELCAKPTPLQSECENSAAPAQDRLRKFGRNVVDAILLMAEVPVVGRRSLSTKSSSGPAHTHRIDVLGIAASTGGPPALAEILGALPARLPIAILVAQHIAHGFSDGLVRWLQRSSALPIVRAQDGTLCARGNVYLPPDGCDLRLDSANRLRTPRSTGLHTPSADELFLSLADSLGRRAAGLVLTGMGDDGAQGLLALRRTGALCYAQEESSCVVYGMPRAAHSVGAVHEFVSLSRMASLIVELS